MLRAVLLACGLGGVAVACSPYGGGAFECTLDTQCGAGTCAGGFCAFPDGACESGFRYGELSGPRSGQCVGDTTMPMVDSSLPSDTALDDAQMVTIDAQACFGTGLVRACFTTPPSAPRTLNAAINTDTSNLCDTSPMNSAWCVIGATTLTVQGTVTATGSKPLVLVATETIDVQGTLDVASRRNPAATGAGANANGCNAGNGPANGGGGAGGSFGGTGGDGGNGRLVMNSGGDRGDALTPTIARGGCRGQNGNGGMAGAGGNGGGVVYLIAETSITVGGSILASGAGGDRAVAMESGGGGGGSGGMIGLDAPTCANNGTIAAVGGGGGEGSGLSTAGTAGGDPVGTTGGTGGGDTTNNGGNGGAGASTSNGGNGAAGTVDGGGGGGGGGAGIIVLDRAATIGGNGTVAPAPI